MTTDSLQRLADHAESENEPKRLSVTPTLERGPVVEATFKRDVRTDTLRFQLDDAENVTEQRDALEGVDGALLVGVRFERTSDGAVIDGLHTFYYVRGVDDDKTESADYVEMGEGYANDTRHPHEHLTNPVGESVRFYLFD